MKTKKGSKTAAKRHGKKAKSDRYERTERELREYLRLKRKFEGETYSWANW